VISKVSESTGEAAETLVVESAQPAEDAVESDLPAVEGNQEEAVDVMLQEQAAEDLPAPDSEAVESTDNNQGENAAGADSDDS